jgi:citrate lyase subunit beta/citryl-CoA lyase
VPTEAEQLWAKRVIEAATSDSAISVDGRMIDKPLVEAARQVLLRAGAKQ